jgi:hypothetical protein
MLLKDGVLREKAAAALAAEMSTDSGYLLTWATVIYNDLIAPCVKQLMCSSGLTAFSERRDDLGALQSGVAEAS